MANKHPYTILDITRPVYAALRALLDRAGYQHRFSHADENHEVIDMQGIALRSTGSRQDTDITVGTVLSSRTRQGLVELSMNGELTQMDLDKAREVVGMLQGAIEAAVSDQLLYEFLTTRVGMDATGAGAALLDFRELRQGSRAVVRPH